MVKRLTGLEALFGANREEHAEQEQIVLAYNLFKQSKTRKDARAIQPLCCDFIDAYEYLPQNLKEDWLDEYKEIIKYMNLELVNAVLTEFGVP